MEVVLRDVDRGNRRMGWELMSERHLADRQTINSQWIDYVTLREKIAENAGFLDYRSYRWKELMRFDYTPEDCKAFHSAIEKTVVPAAQRLAERRKKYSVLINCGITICLLIYLENHH